MLLSIDIEHCKLNQIVFFFFFNPKMQWSLSVVVKWWTDTYLKLGEEARGFSGLFGGIIPGRPFPGGGTGFLGGTKGAAGLGLRSGMGLSTGEKEGVR